MIQQQLPTLQTIQPFLDIAPDAMVIANQEGEIILVNKQAESLFEYEGGELIGKPIETLMPERFRSRHPRFRTEFFANPKTRAMGTGLELYGIKKTGAEFPIEISLNPIETHEGSLVTSAIRDVTERKRTEKAIIEAKKALETANHELEAFSYSVAHDLRAPLRGINGFSQALLEENAGNLSENGKRYATKIHESTRLMARLIEDLLMLAGLSRSALRRDRVSLSDLAQTSAERFQTADSGRQVEVSIANGLYDIGDSRLLGILFDNLLGNAWKFTSHKTPARIEFGRTIQGNSSAYFIRDNGAGFDMAFYQKLFGVFQRLHTISEFEGTGIGLATVQRIIQRHKGRIWAESEVDKGATFYFTLNEELETE